MYKAFIKEWLLDNQSRVYSLITKSYGTQLLDLKPTLFRKWLAKEVDVPEEKINLSSLNSALSRYRKSLAEEKKREKKEITISKINPSSSEHEKPENFVFSNADTVIPKPNLVEL